MAKIKKTKSQRIAELEQKLFEAQAYQVHNHHFASVSLDRLSTEKMMGSGIILSISYLGGGKPFDPVLISDGLSKETIEALKGDLLRSYNKVVEFKPLEVKHGSKVQPG